MSDPSDATLQRLEALLQESNALQQHMLALHQQALDMQKQSLEMQTQSVNMQRELVAGSELQMQKGAQLQDRAERLQKRFFLMLKWLIPVMVLGLLLLIWITRL